MVPLCKRPLPFALVPRARRPAAGLPVRTSHRCHRSTATSHRRQHDDAGSEPLAMAGQPAQTRRFRVKPRGAVVRAGAALTSAVVGELDGGATVVAAAAPDKTGRVAVHTPLRGFVSRKVLIPYGTGHAVPQQLQPKPIIERTKTVTVKSRADLRAFVRHKEQEARRDAGLRDEGFVYNTNDPYERWVATHKRGADPQAPKVRIAYASYLQKQGSLDDALQQVTTALVDEPRSTKARRLFDDVSRDIKSRDAARDATLSNDERALRLWKRSDECYERGDARTALALYGCLLDSMLGETSSSIRLVDGESIEAPRRPFEAREASRLHHARAGCFAKMKNFDDAEEESRRALELEPASIIYRRRLATTLDKAGKWGAAVCEAPRGDRVFEARARVFESRAMLRNDRETRAHANDVAASEWLELVKADEGNPLMTGANPFQGLSRDELRRELETRRERRKAQEAINAALDVEDDRRVAACAVKLCASTFRTRLRKRFTSPLLVVADKGMKLERTASDVGGCSLSRDPLPSSGVHAFCVYVDGAVGDLRIGLAAEGCDFTRPLGDDGKGWCVGFSTHGLVVGHRKRQRDLLHRGQAVPQLQAHDCLGVVWDADAKILDCYVNGMYRGAAFTEVDFPAVHIDGDGEEMPMPPLYAAVSYGTECKDAGACKFVCGRVDTAERIERLQAINRLTKGRGYGDGGKRFSLVTENGERHRKMDAQKMKFGLTRIHTKGVEDAVWVQTDQCRWTQAVQTVTLIVSHFDQGVEAQDVDVVFKPHYLKITNRVTSKVYLEGALHRPILPAESLWYIDDEGVLEVVLAKDLALYHSQSVVELSAWPRLFEFDDDLSDGDMEHDQTDLDPERKRRDDLAQLRSSQQAKFELAKRAAVEASGKEWHWVHRNGEIEPSYAVAGEVGYDVPCDRDAALLASGEPRMMLGA